MKYTHYKNRFASKENGVNHLTGEWSEIVSLILNKQEWHRFTASDVNIYQQKKEHFDAIVMAEMKPNMPRTADSVIEFHAIVLDIDDGATYQDIRNDLAKYEYCLYSSGGTGLKQGDRFRVILPLNLPMKAHEWKKYNTSLTERFPYSDECFKKGIQIQYLPVLNTVFKDQFIAEYHKGEWFDFQNPEDLPYVENQSIESIIKNVVFNEAQFSTQEYSELAKAIIDHQASSLGYEDRRLLAQRLKHIDMPEFDIVQVLDRVSKPGFTRSNADVVAGANPQYAHVEGLYKHIAKGVRIPAIERRIVRSVQSNVPVLNATTSKYDGEFWLEPNEYLSDIIDKMDFSTGINLLISDVATGKSVHWSKQSNIKFVAPLVSIVMSIGSGLNDIKNGNVGTWNQIELIINTKDKTVFKDITLVVDECHGLFLDYNYKSRPINRLFDSFKYFKSVVLMSGTIEADHFSNIEFNNVYRVHKESRATKNIKTFFCTKKDEVVIDWVNGLTNKTIVLMNNKDLCSVVQNKINRKSLIVNADVKSTSEVEQFFSTKLMGDYDVIIGTNSIVEGLSIEDKLDDVEIVIWDDLVPERVEQFCNRFRNVSTSKNVWYFIDRKPVKIVEEYNRDEIIKDCHVLCDGLQKTYNLLNNDVVRKAFVRQFSTEMFKDLVFFHDGEFKISYTGIDHDYSNQRAIEYSNDFGKFTNKLNEYSFNVFYPVMVDGNEKNAEEIKALKVAAKELRIENRKVVLERLRDDLTNGTVSTDSTDAIYVSTVEKIENLLAKGLQKKDMPYCVESYIDDDHFFSKAHTDADFVSTGSTIRDLVLQEVGTKTHLTADDNCTIANKVIVKVLNEYFNGDAKMMVESKSWGGLVVSSTACSSNDLYISNVQAVPQVKSPKAAKEIIEEFIKLGKSKVKSTNGKKVRVASIEALSLTGLVFIAPIV